MLSSSDQPRNRTMAMIFKIMIVMIFKIMIVMMIKIMIVIKPTPMMAMMIMTIVITQLLLTKRHSNGFQENVVCIEDEKAKETNQDSQQIRPANCDIGLSEREKLVAFEESLLN